MHHNALLVTKTLVQELSTFRNERCAEVVVVCVDVGKQGRNLSNFSQQQKVIWLSPLNYDPLKSYYLFFKVKKVF